MLGKNGIFRGKSLEKSFFQEIPRKKMYEKSAPGTSELKLLRCNRCNRLKRFFQCRRKFFYLKNNPTRILVAL
jgi:hypothetical protein